ncbi:MAG TPA: alpha/beta hydrolase [Thermosynechococcus sp. M46_R2017_013]|nr:alpha/beta hydrolase [Thermosynechococcus sp. M46_R2017_013]
MQQLTAKTYQWQGLTCHYWLTGAGGKTPLLFIHPVGVGLSGLFWDRCVGHWQTLAQSYLFYIPDLLGCGQSSLPHLAYYPEDWAAQLQFLIESEIAQGVVLVVQGAVLPVALELVRLAPQKVKALILSGPPTGSLISQNTGALWQRLRWRLFDSPLGWAFYQYARQERFLRRFSVKQLFAKPQAVDRQWLEMLTQGAANLETRHAVYSFLAGFWRRDYRPILQTVAQPVLVVMGDQASSISRQGTAESPQERLAFYTELLPNAAGVIIPGRNVLPYESTAAFVDVCQQFLIAHSL